MDIRPSTVDDLDHEQSDLLIQNDKQTMGQKIDDMKEDKDRIDYLRKQLMKLQEDFEHQLEGKIRRHVLICRWYQIIHVGNMRSH